MGARRLRELRCLLLTHSPPSSDTATAFMETSQQAPWALWARAVILMRPCTSVRLPVLCSLLAARCVFRRLVAAPGPPRRGNAVVAASQ